MCFKAMQLFFKILGGNEKPSQRKCTVVMLFSVILPSAQVIFQCWKSSFVCGIEHTGIMIQIYKK